MASSGESRHENSKKKPRSGRVCTICGETVPFCWSCPCGFQLCQDCMNENAWGLTCNQITWECPDCGATRGY